MQNYKAQIIVLAKRLLLALGLMELTRIIFFILNYSYFSDISIGELLKVLFFGARFDFAPLFYINIVVIAAQLLPAGFVSKKLVQGGLKIFFVTSVSLMLLLNLIDCGFYAFSMKRSTADFFKLFTMGSDVKTLMPQYIKDYWHLALMWITLVAVLWRFYPKLKNRVEENFTIKNKIKATVAMVLVMAMFFSIARGWSLKPLRIISAVEYTEAKYAPLILNTPFTIINTYGVPGVANYKYFSDKQAGEYYTPVKQYFNKAEKKVNVVVFLLESFSFEYSAFLTGNKGYTPYLDSVMQHSLVFTNAFANGKRSIEAVPSVVASLPSYMNEAYISSNFSANKINSLATLLKEYNYNSAFFHGGTNGTMSFDLFSKAAGFNNYYGRKECNCEQYYDGNWGIFDEDFYRFFVSKMNTMGEPFFTCIFSLSSHHPYKVPVKYKNKFKEGDIEIHRAIQYADYSLGTFLKMAAKEKWYKNTLFVFTADHTGPSNTPYFQNKVNSYRVPLVFFAPGDSLLKNKDTNLVQQVDIMPSVLDYIGYNKPFVAFGNSVFSPCKNRVAINYSDGVYQMITPKYNLLFNGEETVGMYLYKNDTSLSNNLYPAQKPDVETENMLKSFIQQYNSRMAGNRLSIK